MPSREMPALGQLVCLLLLCGCALSQSSGGAPSSPCPNVFQYVYNSEGVLQGRISIVPPLRFSRVKLELHMTVPRGTHLVAGVGNIILRDVERETQEIIEKARRGERQQIQFIVVFPPGLPVHVVPRITHVVINGRDFCPNSIKTLGTLEEIYLHSLLATGLNIPVVGGNFFSTPGYLAEHNAFDPPPVRAPQAAYAQQPVLQPHTTSYPLQPHTTPYPLQPHTTPYPLQPHTPPYPLQPHTTRYTLQPHTNPYPLQPHTTPYPLQPHTTPYPLQPHTTRYPNNKSDRRTALHPHPVRTQPPKVPPPVTKRAPHGSPSSANNDQSIPRPGSQHRQCNVDPAEHVDCLKRCDQLEENPNARIQRRDSIKCVFPPDRPLPEASDIHSWIYNILKIPKEYVDTIQLQDELKFVYIKMKSNAFLAGDDIVKRFNGAATFYRYNDVQLTYAGLGNRHVDVRNLPTRISNDKIARKLAEYGHVYNVTDVYQRNVKTGVRSVSIDLDRHIPEVVEIEMHSGRVSYEGQPMRCDRCGRVELRSGCPMNGSSAVYNANVRPTVRPVHKPYELQTTTQIPSKMYHTFPTQYPYNELEQSTIQSPYEPQLTTKRTADNRPSSANKGQSNDICGRPVLIEAVNGGVTREEATEQGQWPWNAAVFLHSVARTKFACAGVLVSRKHVLTAAHCITIKDTTTLNKRDVIIVELGRFDLEKRNEDGQQQREVVHSTVHPQYDADNLSYNVAILTLSSPVEITKTVYPVCIWDLSEDRYPNSIVGERGEVLGWGRDEDGEVVPKLKRTNMPVVSQETCRAEKDPFYDLYVTETTYCAGGRNGTSVCNGDSSGGMFTLEYYNPALGIKRWYVRGIISIGKDSESASDCDNKSYVIFTDIIRVFRWILQQVYESEHTVAN